MHKEEIDTAASGLKRREFVTTGLAETGSMFMPRRNAVAEEAAAAPKGKQPRLVFLCGSFGQIAQFEVVLRSGFVCHEVSNPQVVPARIHQKLTMTAVAL